ncbi:MAG: ParB/RepB/Spo0J family partition protein, partial [Longicatena sp.]
MAILSEITNSVTQESTKKGKMVYLDPHRCKPNPLNSKRKMNDIDELSINILDGGLQQPIVVRQIEESQDYMILTGHRRNLAVLKIVEEGNSYYFNGRLCED